MEIRLVYLLTIVLVSLFLGAGAILLSYFLKDKFSFPFFKTLYYRQLLLLIFGIYGLLGVLVSHYLLIKFEATRRVFDMVTTSLPLLGVPFLIVSWFLFLRMVFQMRRTELPRSVTIGYFGSLVFLFLILGFAFYYFSDWIIQTGLPINLMVLFLFAFMQVTTIGVGIYFLLAGKRKVPGLQRRGNVYFALLYGAMYLSGVLLLIAGWYDLRFFFIYIFLFFGREMAGVGMLTIYYWVHGNDFSRMQEEETRGGLAAFAERYEISRRELQIVDEICKGYSNKEISEHLFISLQTVKDHTHRIYQKAGVRNRVQLRNLVEK